MGGTKEKKKKNLKRCGSSLKYPSGREKRMLGVRLAKRKKSIEQDSDRAHKETDKGNGLSENV